jgi:hypothetical protein
MALLQREPSVIGTGSKSTRPWQCPLVFLSKTFATLAFLVTGTLLHPRPGRDDDVDVKVVGITSGYMPRNRAQPEKVQHYFTWPYGAEQSGCLSRVKFRGKSKPRRNWRNRITTYQDHDPPSAPNKPGRNGNHWNLKLLYLRASFGCLDKVIYYHDGLC